MNDHFDQITLAFTITQTLEIKNSLMKHLCTVARSRVRGCHPHCNRSLTALCPSALPPPPAPPPGHLHSLLLRTADAWPEPQATLINAHGGSYTPAQARAALRLPASLSFLFFLPLHTRSRRQSLGHWGGKWLYAAALRHPSLFFSLSIQTPLT